MLTVIDQAYFEYVADPDYPDAIDAYLKAGQNVVVLRTFSKIYGLAGLRVGYGVGPADVLAEIAKVRRAFDLTSTAQEAALVSLGDDEEVGDGATRISTRWVSSRARAPRAWPRAGRGRRRKLPLHGGGATVRRSSTRCSTTA